MTSRWCCINLASWLLVGPGWNRPHLQTLRSTGHLAWPYGSRAEPIRCWTLEQKITGAICLISWIRIIVLIFFFIKWGLTHAHWSTATRFLLDVCSDCFGKFFWADAQFSQQCRTVYQQFITAESLNVMGVTARNKQLKTMDMHVECKPGTPSYPARVSYMVRATSL